MPISIAPQKMRACMIPGMRSLDRPTSFSWPMPILNNNPILLGIWSILDSGAIFFSAPILIIIWRAKTLHATTMTALINQGFILLSAGK